MNVFIVLRISVLEIETERKVEVELNSSALMFPFKGVEQFHIDLWAIEGAISRIDFPSFPKLVQSLPELFFSIVPHFNCAQVLFRPGGEVEFEFKSEDWINIGK